MHRKLLLALPLLALTGCNAAPKLSGATVHHRCLNAALPTETEIAILGAYEGGERAKKRGFRDHTPGTIRVAAASGAPTLFVLSAYEPVQWDFSEVPVDRVRGVIAYGNYVPTVTGLPDSVPVRIVASRAVSDEPITEPTSACGQAIATFRGGPQLDQLALQAQGGTGIKVTSFSGSYAPKRLNPDWPPIDWRALLGAGERETGAVDPGPDSPALAQLLAQGSVRAATRRDINDWNAAVSARLATGRLAPYASERLRPGSTYVALKPFTVPGEMYGAHSRNFIIPAGMPTPSTSGSHNAYYTMADARCTGASCERDD